ncbi:MAG: hypothetical protein PHY94_03285, partial [Candidatus Omnitrophica bacterium]|nr:hypothetical protein [Candidatus Omnitrophota bacterium]
MNDNISKNDIFSNKDLRQELEINMFLEAYNKKYNADFKVFQKRDKPDYFVKDSKGDVLAVELSSVYMDDTVVATEHKKDNTIEIPYDSSTHPNTRDRYFDRIITKIEEKANKIKNGQYVTRYPIILSLYLNDY